MIWCVVVCVVLFFAVIAGKKVCCCGRKRISFYMYSTSSTRVGCSYLYIANLANNARNSKIGG